MQKRKKKIIITALVLFVGIVTAVVLYLIAPVEVACKVPGYSCATAPDQYGFYSVSYDIEPRWVSIIERKTGKDYPFKYKSGVHTYNSYKLDY